LKGFSHIVLGLVVILLAGTLIQYSDAFNHPTYLTQWGKQGLTSPGLFSFPHGIAIDSEGNVYVTDLGNTRIQKFNNDGTFLYSWGMRGQSPGHFQYPAGIAIDGNYAYVVDNQISRIQKFDLTGNFITTWGITGQNQGQFLLPQGIDIGSDGSIYVADTGNNRIQKFTEDGKFILEFGSSGLGEGQFLSARGIALDSNDNVYVTDPNNNRIQKFSADGDFIAVFNSYTNSNIQKPEGIEIDSNDIIHVVDSTNSRILMLDANGVNLLVWGAPGITNGHFKIPREITVDSNGNLFIVDSGNNRIQKFGSTNSDDKITIQTTQTEEIEVETEQTQVTSEITLASPIAGDFTKPKIIPPNDITVEATSVLTPISIGQASATDESGIKSIESNAPSKFPLGITTIIWTAIDGSGNIAIETQTINVIDLTPPIISAPADVISEATSITENYVDLGNPTTSDNVGIMSITNDAPPVFPLGETIVTWTATDIAGNLENAVQRVIIEDSTKPKIFASDDIILEALSIDQNEVNLGDPEVFDNGIIESITNDAPQFLGLGNTTVTWIAADSAGNIATTTQLITIIDTTAPSISAPEDIVLEATSPIENLDYLGEPTISDVQQITITNDAPSMFSLGKTIITWTANRENI